MRHYETTYILRPNLGEDQFKEIIDRTNAIVTDDDGTIVDVDQIGIRKLAYEIKKESQGYYVYMNYAAHGRTIKELERIFRIDDRLLRYLTIKLADAIDDSGINAVKEEIAAKAAAAEATDSEDPEKAEESTGKEETKETKEKESDE